MKDHISKNHQHCQICKKQFKRVRGMKEHIREVHGGKKPIQREDIYVIHVWIFAKSSKLLFGMTYPWSVIGKKRFLCPQCGLQFYSSTRMKDHISKNHQHCEICKKQFKCVRGLKEHISEVHGGKKPIQCEDIYVILVRNV